MQVRQEFFQSILQDLQQFGSKHHEGVEFQTNQEEISYPVTTRVHWMARLIHWIFPSLRTKNEEKIARSVLTFFQKYQAYCCPENRQTIERIQYLARNNTQLFRDFDIFIQQSFHQTIFANQIHQIKQECEQNLQKAQASCTSSLLEVEREAESLIQEKKSELQASKKICRQLIQQAKTRGERIIEETHKRPEVQQQKQIITQYNQDIERQKNEREGLLSRVSELEKQKDALPNTLLLCKDDNLHVCLKELKAIPYFAGFATRWSESSYEKSKGKGQYTYQFDFSEYSSTTIRQLLAFYLNSSQDQTPELRIQESVQIFEILEFADFIGAEQLKECGFSWLGDLTHTVPPEELLAYFLEYSHVLSNSQQEVLHKHLALQLRQIVALPDFRNISYEKLIQILAQACKLIEKNDVVDMLLPAAQIWVYKKIKQTKGEEDKQAKSSKEEMELDHVPNGDSKYARIKQIGDDLLKQPHTGAILFGVLRLFSDLPASETKKQDLYQEIALNFFDISLHQEFLALSQEDILEIAGHRCHKSSGHRCGEIVDFLEKWVQHQAKQKNCVIHDILFKKIGGKVFINQVNLRLGYQKGFELLEKWNLSDFYIIPK